MSLFNRLNKRRRLPICRFLFFAALSCLVIPLSITGQPSPSYIIDLWDIRDNLPSNGIISITQTPDGFLWIATAKGLTRFDGLTFQTIPFLETVSDKKKETFPEVLYVDRGGIMWIGSSAGLTRYDYQSRAFNTFTAAQGMTSDRIRLINEDMKGNIWISFDVSYINRLTAGSFTPFNSSNGLGGRKINAIVEDANGRILFGTRENGIFRFSNGRFIEFPIQGLTSDYLIITMYEDPAGDLWIGTSKGLFQVSHLKGTTRIYTTENGMSADYITNIIEDREKNLWVGTVNGLCRMTRLADGGFSYDCYLENNVITCLFIDREQSLWAGTYDSGLRRIKTTRLSTVEIGGQHPAEIILSLGNHPAGEIWVGTLSGHLYRCQAKQETEAITIPELAGTGITAIAWDDKERMWLGTSGKGVFYQDASGIQNFTTQDGLADNSVHSIFKDRSGSMWFATAAGVSCFREGKLISFHEDPGGLEKVYNVYQAPDNRIFLATGNGIAIITNGRFCDEPLSRALKGIPVMCILQDSQASEQPGQVIWIATLGAGLKRWKNNTINSYTTHEGMTTNFIYQVFEDRRQNLWMSSDSGILRISKDEFDRLDDKKNERLTCTSFGLDDGMNSTEFNNFLSRHSGIITPDGESWFITRKGIAVVNPDQIKINKTPPPVVIQGVQFNQQPVELDQVNQNSFKKISVATFYFTAPTFLSPHKVVFRYRLLPTEPGWVYLSPGKERVARYHDLPPGSYTFEVTAANNDGVWNNTGISFSFSVDPLFYQTILFQASVILFLALGVIGFIRYRRKKIQQKQHDQLLLPITKEPGQTTGNEPDKNNVEEEKNEKYKRSSLNPIYVEEIIKRLTILMEEEKLYQEENISLQMLSERLSITHHQLSQILNEKLDKSFSDYINYYRIQEAKTLLRDPKRKNQKIITIAFEVGYSTKAAFYNVFKKFTNMTPTEYRKNHEKIEHHNP